jgi:flagellar biosynthesis/type III secretory pathway M-ring protein FliF/YscJ
MTTLEIILAIAVVALAAALVMAIAARRRDRRLVESREAMASDQRQRVTEATARAERSEADKHHARADATEQLAQERAGRERAEAELHEARLRIVALEQRRDTLEEEAGEAPRRSIFRRSSSDVDPRDVEHEKPGLGHGG